MSETGFSPEQIDTAKPHPARMYNYFLGGNDNYEVDRKAAEEVLWHAPALRTTARGNRGFHQRAVRAVAQRGVRQVLEIGAGLPIAPDTREIARRAVGDGATDVRVVYVDDDPIVATYAGARLTNSAQAGFVLADVRQPEAILDHPTTRELLDFHEPVAVLLVNVLHFVKDAEDPAGLVAAFTDRLPDGSCLVLSHLTTDFDDEGALGEATRDCRLPAGPLTFRDHAGVLSFFKGFRLLEPGLVQPPLWRPEEGTPAAEELREHAGYAGVAVKGA